MLEAIRSGLLRMTLVAVGVVAMAKGNIVAACEIVATHTGDGLVGQGMVRPPGKLVDNGDMAFAAKTTFFVNKLPLIISMNFMTIGAGD